jgi:hypothetical protein
MRQFVASHLVEQLKRYVLGVRTVVVEAVLVDGVWFGTV